MANMGMDGTITSVSVIEDVRVLAFCNSDYLMKNQIEYLIGDCLYWCGSSHRLVKEIHTTIDFFMPALFEVAVEHREKQLRYLKQFATRQRANINIVSNITYYLKQSDTTYAYYYLAYCSEKGRNDPIYKMITDWYKNYFGDRRLYTTGINCSHSAEAELVYQTIFR